MGEHKNNPTAQANAGANPAEALRKLIDTPLSEAEGTIALAEIEAQKRQLMMMRTGIDQQLAAAEFDRAIIMRRMMNKPGETEPAKTTMKEPVGPGAGEGK